MQAQTKLPSDAWFAEIRRRLEEAKKLNEAYKPRKEAATNGSRQAAGKD